MQDIINFEFNNKKVRTLAINSEPWFVLTDVCKVLGLKQFRANERLDDDVISNHIISDALGRKQKTTIINEDGLYDCIFESRKKEAKLFRKWVTSEVLPSIRRNGYQESTQVNVLGHYILGKIVALGGSRSYKVKISINNCEFEALSSKEMIVNLGKYLYKKVGFYGDAIFENDTLISFYITDFVVKKSNPKSLFDGFTHTDYTKDSIVDDYSELDNFIKNIRNWKL